MKNLFKILLAYFFVNTAYSQCGTITIPQRDSIGSGGKFCLQGSGTPTPTPDICLENLNGAFAIKQPLPNCEDYRMLLENNTILFNSTLKLNGFNDVSSTYDIRFKFSSAGSAFIRSGRGGALDTYLKFYTNPLGSLDSPVSRLFIGSDGRIGVGTDAPETLFDVYGTGYFCSDMTKASDQLVVRGPNTINNIINGKYMIGSTYSTSPPPNKRDFAFEFLGQSSARIRSFRGNNKDTYLQFLTNGKDDADLVPKVRMQINDDGKVIIGDYATNNNLKTASASNVQYPYKLFVETGILTEKVKVAVKSSAMWADHVFADDYKLKPLNEVENFIKTNNHLPNIPSAEELVADGMDLGTMQAKQMEKIEELTLYLIEMKKEIEILKKENTALRQDVQTLKQ